MMRINQRAFTLFEMLLVVTVLAVIASIGAFTIRQQSTQAHEQTIAQEMQQMAEAAITYSTDHNHWPPELACPATARPATGEPVRDEFITPYVPNENIESSEGTFFCWGWDNGNPVNGDGDLIPPTNASPRFFIALPLPKNIGPKVQALLPNATWVADPGLRDKDHSSPPACTAGDAQCYVRLSIPTPGPVSNRGTSGQGVAAVGTCSSAGASGACSYSAGAPGPIPAAGAMTFTVTGQCSAGDTAVLWYEPQIARYPRKRTMQANSGGTLVVNDDTLLRLLRVSSAGFTGCTMTGANASCSVALQAWAVMVLENNGSYSYNTLSVTANPNPYVCSTPGPSEKVQCYVPGEIRLNYTLYCIGARAG